MQALTTFVIYNSLSELISQTRENHALEYIIHHLRINNGKIDDRKILQSWPNKKQYLAAKATLLYWFNPLKHKSILSLPKLDKLVLAFGEAIHSEALLEFLWIASLRSQ